MYGNHLTTRLWVCRLAKSPAWDLHRLPDLSSKPGVWPVQSHRTHLTRGSVLNFMPCRHCCKFWIIFSWNSCSVDEVWWESRAECMSWEDTPGRGQWDMHGPGSVAPMVSGQRACWAAGWTAWGGTCSKTGGDDSTSSSRRSRGGSRQGQEGRGDYTRGQQPHCWWEASLPVWPRNRAPEHLHKYSISGLNSHIRAAKAQAVNCQ